MKKVLITLVLTFACKGVVVAQTNFHTNVTNLWYQGHKSNVLEIAEQRLSVDTNDIAGLILKYECHIGFLELASISNAAQRVLNVAPTITSTNFARVFPEYVENIQAVLEVLPYYPPAELAADMQKIHVANKPLVATDIIEALQDDGYFD